MQANPLSRSSSVDWSCDEVEEFGALSINAKPKKPEKFPAKLHARKVAKFLGEENGLIYLPGLPSHYYDDSDQTEVFRQRRYFYYLSGMNLPDCVVVYNIKRDKLTAFIPPLNTGRDVLYLGQNPTTEEIETKYDFDEVSVTSSLSDFLNNFAHNESGKIYVLRSSQAPSDLLTQDNNLQDGPELTFAQVPCAPAPSVSCRNCKRPRLSRQSMSHLDDSGQPCIKCEKFGQECLVNPNFTLPPAYGPLHAPNTYRRPAKPIPGYPNLRLPPMHLNTATARKSANSSIFETSKLMAAMDASRVIKTPYELKMLRKANAIAARAHINVLRGIKNMTNEAEIEAIFTATCIAAQAKQQSYAIIAASGENASTLHYGANNEPLGDRQLVCLDAGCDWKCYASDVTRTFPISGQFSKEAQEIYNIVEEMQESCISIIKPGVNFEDIGRNANKVGARGLMDLGILQGGSLEEIFHSGVMEAFFPHGLGHFIGLEVHDVSDDAFGRKNRLRPKFCPPVDFQEKHDRTSGIVWILAPNHVVTVEPGIYFNRYGLSYYRSTPSVAHIARFINWPLLEKYYPVGGVRIEDDILVTEDGYENLTTAPKGQTALDIINGEDEGKGEEVVEEEKVEGKKGWLW